MVSSRDAFERAGNNAKHNASTKFRVIGAQRMTKVISI